MWNVAWRSEDRISTNHNGKHEHSLKKKEGKERNTLSTEVEFNWKLVGNNFSILEIRNWTTLWEKEKLTSKSLFFQVLNVIRV